MNRNVPFKIGDQVAAYFRDSGGDEQELSIQRQLHEFTRWCAENGFTPGRVFKDEARPGSSVVGRQQFHEMMAYFRSGKATEAGLVIWNYQRFARSIDDSQFYRADLRRRGFIFYSMNDEIPDGPMGKFLEAALDWKNEQFLLDLSIDVKSGLRELVEQYGAIPGTPPRGFIRESVQISNRRDGRPRVVHRWVPDPEKRDAVLMAYQMLIDGESLIEITQATGLYRSINSWRTFFHNQLYKGVLEYGDFVIQDYCDPIVPPELWEQAQAILEKRAGSKHLTGNNPDHPRRVSGNVYTLSGLVYCARCGSPMAGTSTKQRNGDYFEQYECSRKKRNRDCDATGIPRRFLEDKVLEIVRESVMVPDYLTARQVAIMENDDPEVQMVELQKGQRKSRLAAVRRQIGNLNDILAETSKEGLPQSTVKKLKSLELEEAQLELELNDLEQKSAARFRPMTPEEINLSSQRILDHLASKDLAEVRRTLRGALYRVTVERVDKSVGIHIQYYFPPEDKPPPGVIITAPEEHFTSPIPRVPVEAHQNIHRSGGCFVLK